MTALAVASFEAAAPFQAAVARLRAERRAIVGLWSPVPVKVGDPELRAANGMVPAMAAIGIAAAVALYLLIWWSAVRAYPFDEGGRPLHSWPAFLVAPVEFGALLAGIAGIVGFLVRARLTRLNDGAFDIDEVGDAAGYAFVVAVRCDAGTDANGLLALLAELHAVHSRLVTP